LEQVAVRDFFRKRKMGDYRYPKQFWLLFGGVFINRASVSMLWPFMTVYMYQTLGVPLTTVTLLLTVSAVFSIFSTAIVSPIMDTFGRKGAMILGLVAAAGVYIAMGYGTTLLLVWAILVAIQGAVSPIFNIGVETMVADLIPKDRRSSAYALIRTMSNAGIAIGPVIGGILAAISFSFIFFTMSAILTLLTVLVIVFIHETKPESDTSTNTHATGYGFILRDQTFLFFIAAYFVLTMAFSNMFSLLPVYLSENFAMSETQYSLTLSINAAMVVFLQFAVTRFANRFSPYVVMTAGAAFYTIGIFSVVFGNILPHFLLSMAIVTLGELLAMPTASTWVANIAPDNMRARYLGILSLGWPIGAGVGPVIGGLLNDHIAPVAIWYGSGVLAMIGTIIFFVLARHWREQRTVIQTTT
jgi:MFS family permease